MALMDFSGAVLEARSNKALNSNPNGANNKITTHGMAFSLFPLSSFYSVDGGLMGGVKAPIGCGPCVP